ncbi:glutathione S-transferase [Boletus reticuloceps]|uniref:Glutathione S-transferase n=1 Tax=Boletus reticuloceps TaxID=495285 RepID=A0A8I3ABK8_9AGAM|nr:glutathione S-transferase [Boletus reticuloceps]
MATPLRLISRVLSTVSRAPLVVSYSPSYLTTSFRTFTMTSTRDTSLQSDIGKMKLEPDGSFNRLAVFVQELDSEGWPVYRRKRFVLFAGPMRALTNPICSPRQISPLCLACVSYVLFSLLRVSLLDPCIAAWATRTLITRKLKGLEDIIPVTVVSPHMGEFGWPFASADPFPGANPDPLYNAQHIRDLYLKVNPNYSGKFTVPVLWDKKLHTIVNNESSEIIRIFNIAFNGLLPPDKASIDIYPEQHRKEIDAINEWVYDTVNNGVYRAGFAGAQEPYEKAVYAIFESLDRLEKMLTGKDYLVGDTLTEADIRLFVTIVRFDPVYVGHFKCNLRTIRNGYPALHTWLRKLYWNNDAFRSSTDFEHIKVHYYWSQTKVTSILDTWGSSHSSRHRLTRHGSSP